jgi:uridine kinase
MGNVNHVRNGSNVIKVKTIVDASTVKEKKKHRNAKYYVKVLIVGTSSCGKSTIAKQLRILYGNPFSEEQRKDYKKILIFNLCYSMKEIISRAKEMNLDFEDKFLVEKIEKLDALETQLTQSNIDDIINLWKDKGNNLGCL